MSVQAKIERKVAGIINSSDGLLFGQEIFKDPVVLSDGITYEREGAEEWLKGHNTSPSFGTELKSKKMISNKYMLLLIKHGLAQRGLVED